MQRAYLLVKMRYTAEVQQFRINSIVNKQEQPKLQVFTSETFRSSHPEVFLGKGILKICSKFTGEHPCRSVISIKLLCRFIEITLRHGYSPVNLLQIFGTPFLKNTFRWLLLRLLLIGSALMFDSSDPLKFRLVGKQTYQIFRC